MRAFRVGIILAILCLIAGLTFAADDFSVEVTSFTDTAITTNQYANFVLSVKNNLDINQTIRVIPNDPSWIVDTEPKSDYLFTVSANGERFLYLTVRPKASENLDLDRNYIVDVNLFSETTKWEENARLNIRLQNSLTAEKYRYAKCIKVVPVYPSGNVDPREEIIISTNFSESTCGNLDNITVTVTSELFEKESIPDTEMVFNIDPQTKPGVYPVVMYIKLGDFEVRKPTLAVKIMPYEYVEKVTKEIQSSLFGIITVKEISLENKGNIDLTGYEFKIKKGFTDVFNSYQPKPEVIEVDDGRYYTWKFNMKVDDVKTIVVKSNYTVLVILIVVAVLLLIYLILTRPKIEVIKKVVNMSTNEEGLSKFKVMLVIRNITSTSLTNIKVNDKLPHIATMVPTDYVGTIKPSKILKHPHKGTIVIWDVEELHPKEERVLYYIIQSKLNIIGSFNLPSAVAKIKDIFGRMVKVTSNKATAYERKKMSRIIPKK